MNKELKELLDSFKGIESITWIPEKDRDALHKSLAVNNDTYATHLLIQNCLSNYILEKIQTIEELLNKKAYHDIYVYLNAIDVVHILVSIYTYTNLDIPTDNYKELIEVISSRYNKIKELTHSVVENMMNNQDHTFERIVVFKLYCLRELVNYDYQNTSIKEFGNATDFIRYIEDVVGNTIEECKACYRYILFNRLPAEDIEAFKQNIRQHNTRIFKDVVHKFIADNF